MVKLYRGSPNPAVNGLNFTVGKGEIYGLLGPNGAGKTTAISIICTLLRPTSGSVTLCDHDVVSDPAAVRPLFGLAPQEVALYTSLTARENLRYFGRLYGLTGQTLSERIDYCLTLVGLSDKADTRVETYSGGMKRRANLAAAILHEPRLLVLDEPTVGIDAQSRNMLLENLKGLRDTGMTIMYTTHYMEEAQQLCSRVAVVDHGCIIATGTPDALIDQTEGCTSLEDVFLHLTGKQLRD
ncbi:MAG: ABC transporter ATP-binding protein [Desulfuromonadaceae bacterium]|nr:ABC transporter ATP-binding protein [Desulfuromonadaceae bacterium]